MYFTPIMLSLFIVVQGICSYRNMKTVFWDFMNKIAYIVLQEIDKFWGRPLWKSNNSYFSTSSSNIAVKYILVYFLKTCA